MSGDKQFFQFFAVLDLGRDAIIPCFDRNGHVYIVSAT
jgi:hypothetical protein